LNPYYREYSDYLRDTFGEGKFQKITINIGLGCPNRDGTTGRGGCTYCNNAAFSPAFASARKSVSRQIADGKEFFKKKYPTMRYMAYFQSYTSTHGDIDTMMSLYEEAMTDSEVVGIIIGTRPDCVSDELLDRLAAINGDKRVMIEFGAESTHDATLAFVNRCHTWADTVDAVMRCARRGISTGLHFILGLPGEDRAMMLQTIERVNALPIDTVKFHQLQIVRGTRMAADIESGLYAVRTFEVDEYIDLCCDIVARLRRDIAIERFVSQSPDTLLIAPRWGLKNYEFTAKLQRALKNRITNQ
jgi:radical SAM protein (TIGR01212 family)